MKKSIIASIILLANIEVNAEVVSATEILPNGPEQMPLVFVHGWKADGAEWFRGVNKKCWDSSTRVVTTNDGNNYTASEYFEYKLGMPSYMALWWSHDGGNASSTEGFSYLADREYVLDNSIWNDDGRASAEFWACPSDTDILFHPSSENGYLYGFGAGNLFKRPNYNNSGLSETKADELRERLIEERTSGVFQDVRQINIMAHSQGSLISRIMLSKIASNGTEDEKEFIANAYYNAPPFAGTNAAEFIAVLYSNNNIFTRGSNFIADPSVQKIMDSYVDSLPSDMLKGMMNMVLRPIGLDIVTILENPEDYPELGGSYFTYLMEIIFNTLDTISGDSVSILKGILLEEVPLTKWITLYFYNDGSRNMTIADTLTAPFSILRPLLTSQGFPAKPALFDLTPKGASNRISTHPTSSHTPQFVSAGKIGVRAYSPLLFPCELPLNTSCINTILSNLSLLHDYSKWDANFHKGSDLWSYSDVAVPTGSAYFFSAQNKMIATPIKDMDITKPLLAHTQVQHDITRSSKDWAESLVVKPTKILLNGSINTVSGSRTYVVSENTQLTLISSAVSSDQKSYYSVDGSIETSNEIKTDYFEFRFILDNGTKSEWKQHQGTYEGIGNLGSISTLTSALSHNNEPFEMEWRATNIKGGREHIRNATFVIAPPAPVLMKDFIFGGSPDEVKKSTRFTALNLNPILRDKITKNNKLGTNGLLDKLIAKGHESAWMLSNPDGKSLFLTFNTQEGRFKGRWNNDDLSIINHNKIFTNGYITIDLFTLSLSGEGVHTLYYTTEDDKGVNISPIRSLQFTVDNTSPEVTFQYESTHPIGFAVGPNTPLKVGVHDEGVGGGTASLIMGADTPSQEIEFTANRTFTLGETNLKRIGEESGMQGFSLDGLNINAKDAVGNDIIHTINRLYYDFTAPSINVVSVSDSIKIGNDYNTSERYVNINITADEIGSAPTINIRGIHAISSRTTEFALDPLSLVYQTARVYLPYGVSEATISVSDHVGNIATKTFNIEYAPIDSDSDGKADIFDNCINIANFEQVNTDLDAQGDACDEDDDNDGMSDTWEISFGLDPLDASDATLDNDDDGFTNIEEYQNQTSPNEIATITTESLYEQALAITNSDTMPITWEVTQGQTLPAWLSLERLNSIDDISQMSMIKPWGITRDSSDTIYVVETDGSNIYKITPNGTTTIFATVSTSRKDGVLLAYNATDNKTYLYISYFQADKITKIDMSNVGAGESDFIIGINSPETMVEKNGFIYVTQYHSNKISKISSNGTVSDYITGIDGPSSLYFTENGELYVTLFRGKSLIRFAKNSVTSPTTLLSNSTKELSDVKVDKEGNIYLATRLDGVQKYTPSMTNLESTDDVRAMIFNSKGELLYNIYNKNKLVKLDNSYKIIGTPPLGSGGTHNIYLTSSDGVNHIYKIVVEEAEVENTSIDPAILSYLLN